MGTSKTGNISEFSLTARRRIEPPKEILSQALNTWGNIQLATGETSAALSTWEKAEQAYAKIDDTIGIVGGKLNQAQALQLLGMYRRSQLVLSSIYDTLQQMPLYPIKAIGLLSAFHYKLWGIWSDRKPS
jgi:hypothetical protein